MYCEYLTSGKVLEKLPFYIIVGEDTENVCSNSGIVENMRSEILVITKITHITYPKYHSLYLNIYGIVRALGK